MNSGEEALNKGFSWKWQVLFEGKTPFTEIQCNFI
jgi:hypothetical protein